MRSICLVWLLIVIPHWLLAQLRINSAADSVQQYSAGDSARWLINRAMERRATYEKEVSRFCCEIDIAGDLELHDVPDKFMGKKMYFSAADSGKRNNIYSSETRAVYCMDGPHRSKLQILSSRVKGEGSGYGFSYPQLFSLYQPVVKIGDNLTPRGFVSPLADNGFNYYRYHFEGSRIEEGRKINRIGVTPLRKYEPAFSGFIDLLEDSRIYGVHLEIVRQQQMQILDTLIVEQLYAEQEGVWVLKKQELMPYSSLLGFKAKGHFIQVHQYNLHPVFSPAYFDNVTVIFDTAIDKKSLPYWDTARALIVQSDPLVDYHTRDSMGQLKNRDFYFDSVDRMRNNPSWFSMLVTGETFSRSSKRMYTSVPGVYDMVNYNTVEGVVVNISPETRKYWNNGRYLNILTNVRYGFSNSHFNAHIAGVYRFAKSLNALRFAGGQRVYQFNNAQPITPRVNTINTLLYRSNFMKLYEAKFAELGYDYDPASDFALKGLVAFQHCTPLENTAFGSWGHPKGKEFTPNYPIELTDSSMTKHNALSATVTLRWQPGAKYMQLPDRKVSLGSEYPVFELSYTQGIEKLLSSDVNYGKWSLTATQELDWKLRGRFNYRLQTGGFLNSDKVQLPDYQHFNGNDGLFTSSYLGTLLMASFYQYSTISSIYGGASFEYHLKGLLSNKVPLIRKLNWYFVVGGNSLFLEGGNHYMDVFFSIENIFKIARIDFVQSFRSKSFNRSGIKISIPLVTGKREP